MYFSPITNHLLPFPVFPAFKALAAFPGAPGIR
jgi:hypothetical protein